MAQIQNVIAQFLQSRQEIDGVGKVNTDARKKKLEAQKLLIEFMVENKQNVIQAGDVWIVLEESTPDARLDDAMYMEIFLNFHRHPKIEPLSLEERTYAFPNFLRAYIKSKGESRHSLKVSKTKPGAARIQEMMGSM